MTTKSPFKFLDSYTKEDKNIFFGRNQEIEQLYQKVFESKLLLVYGVSGTGKSSLIQCGLANKFNDSDWLPINIRKGSNINESLKTALSKKSLSPIKGIPAKAGMTLSKIIKSVYLDHFKPIYLIFDQFEELFIFGSDAEKDEFIQTVKKLVDSDIQCKLIFAIREEYLANITEFEREIPSFLENRMRIEKMRPTQAENCVEGPCIYANISLEDGVSQELLKRLTNDKNEIELTWLQVFLDKLYRTTTTEPKQFTHALLQQMGKVSDLLGSFLDEQITQSTKPDETLAILKSFVSIKGTKRQISLKEVQSYCQTIGKQINENDLKIELQHLVTLRILRDKDENGRYELRHDALAAKIYEKITLVEKELMEVRQFIENAYANYQKRKVLLSKEDLSYIAVYEDKIIINNELKEFIKKCKQFHLRAKKRRQLIIILATLFLLLAFTSFSIWALNERNKAVHAIKKEEKAKEDRIIAERKFGEVLKSKGGIIVSAEKMNILYYGIENPVNYAIPGTDQKLINYWIDPKKARVIEKKSILMIIPRKIGYIDLVFFVGQIPDTTIVGSKKFKVLNVPEPIAMIGGKKGGNISKNFLLSQKGIDIIQENFIYDLKFKPIEFKMIIQDGIYTLEYPSKGRVFSTQQRIAINKIKRGSRVLFENIKAKGPDGKVREISGVIFKIK